MQKPRAKAGTSFWKKGLRKPSARFSWYMPSALMENTMAMAKASAEIRKLSSWRMAGWPSSYTRRAAPAYAEAIRISSSKNRSRKTTRET